MKAWVLVMRFPPTKPNRGAEARVGRLFTLTFTFQEPLVTIKNFRATSIHENIL